VVQVADCVVMHEVSSSSHNLKLDEDLAKNRLRSLTKNYETRHVFQFAPVLTMLYLGRALFAAIRFRESKSVSYTRAIAWNILNLKDTWKQRIQTQEPRRISDDELFLNQILIRPRIDFRSVI
jgi:hypothetical protein